MAVAFSVRLSKKNSVALHETCSSYPCTEMTRDPIESKSQESGIERQLLAIHNIAFLCATSRWVTQLEVALIQLGLHSGDDIFTMLVQQRSEGMSDTNSGWRRQDDPNLVQFLLEASVYGNRRHFQRTEREDTIGTSPH